jgi:hypothetical protein
LAPQEWASSWRKRDRDQHKPEWIQRKPLGEPLPPARRNAGADGRFCLRCAELLVLFFFKAGLLY